MRAGRWVQGGREKRRYNNAMNGARRGHGDLSLQILEDLEDRCVGSAWYGKIIDGRADRHGESSREVEGVAEDRCLVFFPVHHRGWRTYITFRHALATEKR